MMMEIASAPGWTTYRMPVNHFVLLWEPIPGEKLSDIVDELEALAGKFNGRHILVMEATRDLLHRAAKTIQDLRADKLWLRDQITAFKDFFSLS
jgi:hypothetical protein